MIDMEHLRVDDHGGHGLDTGALGFRDSLTCFSEMDDFDVKAITIERLDECLFG